MRAELGGLNANTPTGSTQAPPHLLLVDDNRDYRILLARMLQRAGFIVQEAEDGSIALELLSREVPQVLITDWQMPGLDGAELVAIARGRWPGLPIVAISCEHRNMPSGVRAFFQKGLVPLGEIASAIDQIVHEAGV